jgi:mannose-6-phosphate isomerase-like protein (cupin superfamily)
VLKEAKDAQLKGESHFRLLLTKLSFLQQQLSNYKRAMENLKPEITKLAGDRDGEGMYTLRQKIPCGYSVKPHFHSQDYFVTVLTGRIFIGYGHKYYQDGVEPIESGEFFIVPAGTVHFEWFTEETIVQVHGLGPVKTEFL